MLQSKEPTETSIFSKCRIRREKYVLRDAHKHGQEEYSIEHDVPSQHWSDSALIQCCLTQQNEHAYTLLYQRHSPEILRRLRRLLSQTDTVEDALQQVFLQAFQYLADYRGESPFRAWLHRIAERVVYAQYQKQWRSKSLLSRALLFGKAPSFPEVLPDQILLHKQVQDWVQLLLQRLSPKKRLVLLLCLFEEKTIEEVAERLELPPGTVASRLYHARKELSRMVKKELKQQHLTWKDLIDAS